MKDSTPKRKHHKVPRYYLKGFVERESEPFLWVYRKGFQYKPGRIRYKYNPYRDSINFVGAEIDYYASANRDGVVDYETFENILERLEKPADPVIKKIRDRQMITMDEKVILASYIVLMLKRVERRRQKAARMWPSFLEEFESSSDLLRAVAVLERDTAPDDTRTLERLKKVRAEIERVLGEYKANPSNVPSEILHKSMISPGSRLVPTISQMNWQFLVAPGGSEFLTSDNPVFFFEGIGLNKPQSEITFPVSSDVAIAAFVRGGFKEDFVTTTTHVVAEINRRTAHSATIEVYHSRSANWVVDVLNKRNRKLNQLDPS
jgi:hypothetical protein